MARTLGLHLRDVDCAFKLLRRTVVDEVLPALQSRAAFISPEIVIRAQAAGFRVREVGVDHYPRVAGTPKGASPKVILRTVQEMMRRRAQLRAPVPTVADEASGPVPDTASLPERTRNGLQEWPPPAGHGTRHLSDDTPAVPDPGGQGGQEGRPRPSAPAAADIGVLGGRSP